MAATRYTTALGERICQEIADGLGLAEVCRLDGMPHRNTVRLWLASDAPQFSGFRAMYARAREEQAHTHADRLVEVARTASPETAAADRLHIDALKWAAAKRAPRVYGDRLALDFDPAKLTDEQLAAVAAGKDPGGV